VYSVEIGFRVYFSYLISFPSFCNFELIGMIRNDDVDKQQSFFPRILCKTTCVRIVGVGLLLMQASLFCAKQISLEQSLGIARNFYQARHVSNVAKVKSIVSPVFSLDYIGYDSPKSSRVKALVADTSAYFYVYNVGANQGFIVVSGDDATKPILAYSDQAQFPATNIPTNVLYWLDFYKSEIKFAQQCGLSTSVNDTTAVAKAKSATASVVVQPLLGNIKWDQSYPYNLLCPYNSTQKAHSVTGCVATAMAQLMKYYQWPVRGTGSFTYTDGTNGSLTANFGNTTYDWSNMLDTYGPSVTSTAQQDTDVATLMYQCGVAVSMTYSPSGSFAAVSDAALALKNHFSYDADINLYSRQFYNTTDWINMIKTELDASRPMLYGGDNGTEGHAFIADGYDSNDLFHFNWGWSGYYDGYYEVSVLNPPPSGSTGGSTGGFNQNQQIVTGIRKPDGVTNSSYLLNIYNTKLSSSISSLSNITSQKFNVSFGFLNYGLSTFTGKIGIGLYKDGIFQKTVSTYTSNVTLASNYGSSSFSLSGLSLSGLATGSYKLYCIHKASSASAWTIMNGTNQLNNYLNVVVSGSTATILAPSLTPTLTLTQPIAISGNAYQNKLVGFSVTVQNTGNEFYSNMGIKLISTTNASVTQFLNYGVVDVANGEAKTLVFRGTVTSAPGSYYAVAVCDSTNAFSSTSFKVMTPGANNQIAVTVQNQPAAANLSLTAPISLSDASTIVAENQNITLNASITNTGGYYDSDIIAFVFPAGGGSSVGYLDPKSIYIDTNETQSISFTGSLNLDPGLYSFKLYYNPSSWIGFAPSAMAALNFTLNPVVATVNSIPVIPKYSIYPNPVADLFGVSGMKGTATVSIADMQGRVVLTKEVFANESISVSILPQGMYIVSLVNEEGKTELKLLKK
jgi:hypothetical protein